MRRLAMMTVLLLIAGCGAEVAGTAATGAAIKQQELKEGAKSQQRAQQKLDEAVQQMQQRAQHGDPASR